MITRIGIVKVVASSILTLLNVIKIASKASTQ